MGPAGPKTEWKSPMSWGALADMDVEEFMHPSGTQPIFKTRQ